MLTSEEKRESLLSDLLANQDLAHEVLFAHRHKDITPEFHHELRATFNSSASMVAVVAFRGGAKSTIIEEYIILNALFRKASFILVVGASWDSACQRLTAIKQELLNNDLLIELFGNQMGSPWAADEIVLSNGVKIKAVGAGQTMRGLKHNDERPDLAVIDDLEDETTVHTEEARRKLDRWLSGTLRPALHPIKKRIRFIGTPLHPKALIERKCSDSEWTSARFPVLYIDDKGEEKSMWPSRFPLEEIKKLRTDYMNNGNMVEFEQEYMCHAEDIAGKPFQPDMIKVEAINGKYLSRFLFVDPARTTKSTSARTGYVDWSWMGSKLIVNEAFGAFHKPNEILKTIDELDKKNIYTQIYVEADGLEEFLMQPLREMQLQLGHSLPIVAERAPRDKDQFILGLQPFYKAGDVIHTKNLPDLNMELLQFPTGRKDVINALAYALKTKAGRPVYEDFTKDHIAPVLEVHSRHPRYLVISSRPSMTSAILVQFINGVFRIYKDWILNQPPRECLKQIIQEATLFGGEVKLFSPMENFDKYNNWGLPAAVKDSRMEVQKTKEALKSEGELKGWLQKQIRGDSAVLVHESCRWVINGLSSGYARKLEKGGYLSDKPIENQYKLIIESLESFVSFINSGRDDRLDSAPRVAYTKDGRKYISSLPR